jgi:formylglycine-generating enzyme required for sulfatase activity
MVFVPAGYFTMGSATEDLRNIAEVDEWPQRQIWVDDFYIDIHEVTNAQYKLYIDSMKVEAPHRWVNNNYGIGEDGLPVVSISWSEAAGYARFVGKRLPTEAEWEKAARGTNPRRFPWGNQFDVDMANNGNRLMPIMSFPKGVSPFGCFDMAGNAAEWVDAWYESYPRSDGDVLPDEIPDRHQEFKTDRRVYRGGSWNSFGKFLRCANRESTGPNRKWVYVGFRCAMDPPWKQE